jgi:hypothetical protein
MWPVLKRSIVLGVLTLAGASGTAYAEYSNMLDVNVPFPFEVGNEMLPAGHYVIERDDNNTGALIIRGQRGTNAVAFLNTRPGDTRSPKPGQSAVQFRRDENRYRLSDIWMPDRRGESVEVR